jgi:hypothetical protein
LPEIIVSMHWLSNPERRDSKKAAQAKCGITVVTDMQDPTLCHPSTKLATDQLTYPPQPAPQIPSTQTTAPHCASQTTHSPNRKAEKLLAGLAEQEQSHEAPKHEEHAACDSETHLVHLYLLADDREDLVLEQQDEDEFDCVSRLLGSQTPVLEGYE